MWFTRSRVNYL